MSNFIKNSVGIEEIRISSTTDAIIKVICDAMVENDTIHSLAFDRAKISKKSLKRIQKLLTRNHRLRRIQWDPSGCFKVGGSYLFYGGSGNFQCGFFESKGSLAKLEYEIQETLSLRGAD